MYRKIYSHANSKRVMMMMMYFSGSLSLFFSESYFVLACYHGTYLSLCYEE